MVGERQTELKGCTASGQDHSERPIVEFSSAILAPKTLDVVSFSIIFALVVLVASDANLLFRIR